MMIPKGYRAREAAGLNRKVRGRIDPEIRAQRAAVLEPKIHKAILRNRDKHELKAVFEAQEREAAEKKASETTIPVQPEQPVKVEQTEQVDDALFEGDDEPATADGEPEQSADERQVEAKPEQAASKPKSKPKTKNK